MSGNATNQDLNLLQRSQTSVLTSEKLSSLT